MNTVFTRSSIHAKPNYMSVVQKCLDRIPVNVVFSTSQRGLGYALSMTSCHFAIGPCHSRDHVIFIVRDLLQAIVSQYEVVLHGRYEVWGL
jgi:hypothetical protein